MIKSEYCHIVVTLFQPVCDNKKMYLFQEFYRNECLYLERRQFRTPFLEKQKNYT